MGDDQFCKIGKIEAFLFYKPTIPSCKLIIFTDVDDDIFDVEEKLSGFLENVYSKGIKNLKKQRW